ncbi:MAG: pilus assembly protein MshP [Gammaproteobacteria bacterium]|nr:pilus assembly protein MshP [Gammaproteobacteria bacterium]
MSGRVLHGGPPGAPPRPRSEGFALVPALFLIVVVGALAAVALRLVVGQQTTASSALLQAEALAAARSGIEWSAYRALHGTCASGTLSLAEGAANGFTVVVSCSATAYADGAGNYSAFLINATATRGQYGTADYVRRVVRASFTNETP